MQPNGFKQELPLRDTNFTRQNTPNQPQMEDTLMPVSAEIKEDYAANYFVNGAGDMDAYEDDCLFTDPFTGFRVSMNSQTVLKQDRRLQATVHNAFLCQLGFRQQLVDNRSHCCNTSRVACTAWT